MSTELEKLIKKGQALIEEPSDSPRVKIWKSKANNFVSSHFDAGMLYAFSSSFTSLVSIDSGQNQVWHRQDMGKAILCLEELQDEPMQEKPVPELPKKEKANSASNQPAINITVHANPVNNNSVEIKIDNSLGFNLLTQRVD